MRTVVIFVIITLMLLAACGEATLLNAPNKTNEPTPSHGAGTNVTETTIEQGNVTPTPAPTETPPTPPSTPPETPPAAPTNTTTTPVVPPTVPKGACPIISAEDVAHGCNKSAVPNVTVDGTICRFHWGEYEVNVTSQSASLGDYNAWVNTIPTSLDGKFKPVSMLAEYNRMKYYGWYTGKRLIIVTSNNVLGCALSRLDGVIQRVNPDVTMAGEVSTADKLAGAVADTGKKSPTNIELATLLTMAYDKSIKWEGNYTGTIRTAWKNGYTIMATLQYMDDATYSAYLVRKTNWHAYKLGTFEKQSDAYRLIYTTSTDARDHNWFVLTTVKDGKETILSETSLS